MDFLQLQYFISAAQMLNFTRAAEMHYVTQPAISRRISDLEKELGVQLFVRSSHEMALTNAGQEFLRYAQSVLDMTAETTHHLKNIAMGKTGKIRISAVPATEPALYKVLSEYSSRYPDVRLDLDFSTGKSQIAAINSGEYDFYFSFESLLKYCKNLEYLNTFTDRYYLFVPSEKAHTVDANKFSTLGNLPLVTELHSEGPFLVNQMMDILHARGYDTENIIGCKDIHSVAVFVNAGMGFTLLPFTMSRSICTDRLISFFINGDDAQVVNAVGWEPDNCNNAAISFRNLLYELYSSEPDSNGSI
ncbi:MAG: LysR family transcriptional regulator [Oscillospiraceae bacterium]|nr:LysR family transcriptional regulator [Oscillospiraceae bacterium]